MMAERGLTVDNFTIAHAGFSRSPVLNEPIRSEMRHPGRSWRVDETYVRIAGQ
jgi:transposase-like protein